MAAVSSSLIVRLASTLRTNLAEKASCIKNQPLVLTLPSGGLHGHGGWRLSAAVRCAVPRETFPQAHLRQVAAGGAALFDHQHVRQSAVCLLADRVLLDPGDRTLSPRVVRPVGEYDQVGRAGGRLYRADARRVSAVRLGPGRLSNHI